MITTSTATRINISSTSTVSGFDGDEYSVWIKTNEDEEKIAKLLKQEAIEEMKSGYNNPIVIGRPLKPKVNNKIKVIRNCLIRKIRRD